MSYILVHHTNGTYKNAAREMDRLFGVTHTALTSVRCRKGAYKTLLGVDSDSENMLH